MLMIGTAIVTLLAALILWGLGQFVLRFAKVTTDTHLLSIGVGLSAVVATGGLLNAMQLAFATALWSLIGIGIVITVLELRRLNPDPSRWRQPPLLVLAAALVIVGATLFAIATQAPPLGFNFHDDFEKYFAHPVRMLATGTLAGSPLNSLGMSTLGGQAFLQAFVLSLMPIEFINGLDAVLGLAVLLSLGAAIAWRLAPGSAGVVLVPLAILAINPLYVNTSGVYLPCILMLSAFLLASPDTQRAGAGPAILLGVLYAGLVALKVTFLPFVLVHFTLALVTVFWTLGSWRQSALWGLRVLAGATAGIAPWLLMYWQNYLQWGSNSAADAVAGAGPLPNLLSTAPRIWGESYGNYSLLAALCAAAAIRCWWASRDRSGPEQSLLILAFSAGATGVLCYLLAIFLLGPLALGYENAARYTIPVLTAAAIPALGILPRVPWRLRGVAALDLTAPLCLAVVLAFAPSALARYRQAWNYGSILAFASLPRDPVYIDYTAYALSARALDRVRSFQDQVPPSEPLLAWISTPFHLDYARNPIIDTEPAGMTTPWARVPSGIHYVLWQYRGYAVRPPGLDLELVTGHDPTEQITALRLYRFGLKLQKLSAWAAAGELARVVAKDDEFVLFAVTRLPD
jgi:hypothetical protein